MKPGALHREWSLWNQLLVANAKLLNKGKTLTESSPETAPDISVVNEKEELLNEKSVLMEQEEQFKIDSPYSNSGKKNGADGGNQLPSTIKKLGNSLIVKLLLVLIPLLYFTAPLFKSVDVQSVFSHECSYMEEDGSNSFMKNLASVSQIGSPAAPYANSTKPHEVIAIPYFPETNISSPVYSQVLLEESFASSWNQPVLVKYTPPPTNITYNKVILTLDTTIDGVQYDRMVHVYLNNNEIWRSSTMEPSGKLSHSFAQRDATMYYKLFTQPGELLVQLDNLVTSKLTGVFDITLSAVYLNTEEKSLRTSQHPDIIPLTASKYGTEFPPIVYYPDSKLSVSIPEMHYNTTELILLLTTSPNAAEEFWYSNLLDEYKNAFISHDRHFYGHGSCRVINVFVNGIRVHTTNPKPYIFSGGIAPPLWESILSTGGFNIVPSYIDLTPVLPLLWDSSAQVEIDISNCIDDDVKTIVESGIGSNWITSASLAVWEDSTIESSYGEVETFDNSTAIKSFAINPPFSGFLTQIIKASYANSFQTNITHTYSNGTEFSKLTNYTNEANQTSFIAISKFGDSQSIISIPQSQYERVTLDPETNEILKTYTMLTNSSLATALSFLPATGGKYLDFEDSPAAQDISFNVSLKLKENTGAYNDAVPLFEISSKENGTAEFTIAAGGNNFGTGTMLHNYTYSDIRGKSFNRVALAEDDEIVYDNYTDFSVPKGLVAPTPIEGVSSSNDEVSESISAMNKSFDWLSDDALYELNSVLSSYEVDQLLDALEKQEMSC